MRRRSATILLAPVLALLFATAPAASQQDGGTQQREARRTDRFRTVRAHIQKLVTDEGVPSIAVAVAKDGAILWEEGFGWADRERRVPATPHTPYSLASVTKPITSTAVMLLVQQGRIDLDAPIGNYLGRLELAGLGGDPGEVTPRRMMAHSAGLPTHFYFYHAGYPPASAEETITRYGTVVFPPGRRFQYSNIGYRSLDVAVSNVSGQSYGDFLHREIFLPLGMNRSALDVHPAWAAEAATRYDGKQSPIPPYMSDHPGSGDVWSSAHDVLRFGMLHVGTPLPGQRRILEPETIRTMQQDASAPGARWGLGWSLETDRGHRVVRHGGQQPGVDNQLVLYPDERLVIVVLSNRNDPKVRGLAREIAAAVLPQPARGRGTPAPGPRSDSLPALSGRWIGTVTTYQGTETFSLTFQPDGDIHARLGNRMSSLVNHLGRDGGALTGWFYGVMNTSDALRHRHNLFLTVLPEGGDLVGQLVAETPTDPAVFALSSFVRLRREPAGESP